VVEHEQDIQLKIIKNLDEELQHIDEYDMNMDDNKSDHEVIEIDEVVDQTILHVKLDDDD
jgi:hypothetical protein